MVAISGLRDRFDEPGVAGSERIASRRESDLEVHDYGYPTPNARPSRRSENVWDAKRSARLIAQKFDGSKHRQYPGGPRVSEEVAALVIRMAKEDSGWGFDRIVGALANLGHHVSDQTVGNILHRHGIAPAPKRSQITTWLIWMCWRVVTFSQSKGSLGEGW